MWDSSNGVDRRRLRRPSLTQLLGVGLVLSLALAGYLFWHPEIRASQFLSTAQQAQVATAIATTPVDQVGFGRAVSATVSISTSIAANLPPSADAMITASTTPDVDVMIQQLQAMQNSLQAVSGQFDAQNGLTTSAPVVTAPPAAGSATGLQTAAMLVEIEQLYQVMQPLMQQIQAAVQSSRPESELVAMRAQMENIHSRLADLMARVQANKANPTAMPVGQTGLFAPANRNGYSSSNPVDPNDAVYEQLQQMLTQLQSMLDQMQNAAPNTPWTPGPGAAPFALRQVPPTPWSTEYR